METFRGTGGLDLAGPCQRSLVFVLFLIAIAFFAFYAIGAVA
jgi:hypothetical protein